MDLVLPFPPSLNAYYGHARNHEYIRKAGLMYRVAVYRAVKEQVGDFKFTDPVAVFATLHYATKLATWDLDNYQKALFDALTLCNFWSDDSQIHELHLYKGNVVSGGRVVLTVEHI